MKKFIIFVISLFKMPFANIIFGIPVLTTALNLIPTSPLVFIVDVVFILTFNDF